MVIGLEVHIELKTKTKIFCSCPTDFGAEPNTQCCPVCMGYPGTLPVLNRQVAEFAVKAGLATNCTIARYSKQDRKNYFYPDLPKAYQISQFDLPLCEHGWLEIESDTDPSGLKKIGITRIHIEEDAGKLIHDDEKGTLIDCNRCGVPLIEVVSEPDIRSSQEAVNYVQKLRSIALYTGVSDCKMNEGSLRCDVNLSVHKPGEPFGTRTEMKNLNSFTFIAKAIEYEYRRQVDAIEAGEAIVQETRRFAQEENKTYTMRRKEDADDYRYFPDPDLPPIELSEDEIARLRAAIPELPDERRARYEQNYGLSSYDALKLTESKELSDYFESCAKTAKTPKIAANMLITDVFRMMTPEDQRICVSPEHFAALSNLVVDQVINSSTAKKVLKEIWGTDKAPEDVVREQNLAQINDESVLRDVVAAVLAANEKSVNDYKNGKLAAAKSLMGQAMAKTSGKANPVILQKLMDEALNQ
ncbi:MAG: Asp-tRNA(Asn)/Glu-tRNA(Gln) amidotransferase subunit GatB [Clostridia bacterium]|nr:Asp-tRNA(Asn)/Glu-tRNA(Gln) amidotransferase subunit GatB [Clostridia bacterium]